MNYLTKLKEKCNIDDDFMNIIYQIFDKLVSFGYITKRQEKQLERKLYNNIDVVIFGSDISIDYKTGYYDAIKKELYIKDINNLEAIYLRILYALTTDEISKNSYSTGYSIASMSDSNYKIVHENFGINRAIISNLVCRLLYTLPTTLSIVPTYRSYENDFLGNKVTSDNDIYFLEGKLLSQLCYVLNVSEEEFYIHLFLKPRKYLNKFFSKHKFNDSSALLKLFDKISRKYSNYNKLVFLNKILDDNYINIKKNALKKTQKEKLEKEQEKIKMAIRRALEPLSNLDNEDEDIFVDIEASLSEKQDELEEKIQKNITKIQDMLIANLFKNELKYSNIEYAVKLKTLNSLLVIRNEDIEDKCYDIISHKILNTFESTTTNLTEKIKYSLVQEILSSDKYLKIYKNMGFKNVNGIDLGESSKLVALTVDNDFIQLIKIDNLTLKTKELKNNTTPIQIESLGYLLNNPSATFDINYVEKVFTKIKVKFNQFTNTRIENMYICNINGIELIVIPANNNFSILQIIKKEKDINLKLLKLSENFLIFTTNTNTNLPILYNTQKESSLKKVLSFMPFFS